MRYQKLGLYGCSAIRFGAPTDPPFLVSVELVLIPVLIATTSPRPKPRAQGSEQGHLPSLSMPTLRHFMKRQAWQDLRLRLVISHSFVAGQLYSMLPTAQSGRERGSQRGRSGETEASQRKGELWYPEPQSCVSERHQKWDKCPSKLEICCGHRICLYGSNMTQISTSREAEAGALSQVQSSLVYISSRPARVTQ